MRKNQVTITIDRFGDQVPKKLKENRIQINVYADSNNVYEALAAAFNKAMYEIGKYEKIPDFGCVTSQTKVISSGCELTDNDDEEMN